MSFGWSVGDLIAAINLLINVYQAFDDSRGGKASYGELIRELSSLQNALQGIQSLRDQELFDSAILNCQKCIDYFVARIKKFKGMDKDHGESRWSLKTFKKHARTVEWAILKKSEVDIFRKEVQTHTSAILSLQVSALSDQIQNNAKIDNKYQKDLIENDREQRKMLVEAQEGLQDIRSSQVQLLEELGTASNEHKNLGFGLKSQLSEISKSQTQEKDVLDQINEGLLRTEKGVEGLKKATRSSEFVRLASDCLKSLFVVDPSVNRKEIETRKDKLIENSCDWILPQFLDFLEKDSAPRLWIHGPPGKGKTMICLALVDELLKLTQSRPKSLCCYFFCDNTSDKRNTLLLVMKTLLHQVLQVLLQQQTKNSAKFLESFDIKGENMFCSVEAVWIEIHRALEFADLETAYFVIDGLDECEEEDLENFLVLLTDDHIFHSSCIPKWILLSRNEGAMKSYLQTSTSTSKVDLEANSEAVRSSVDRFIEVKVDDLANFKTYKPELKEFVARTLKEKAEGTFLWVSLACQELRRPKVLSINTRLVLEMMPRGLPRFYDRIYTQAMTNDIEEMIVHVRNILRSVTLASRPLSPGELAIIAGLPSSAIEDMEQFNEYLEQCGSLLLLQESGGIMKQHPQFQNFSDRMSHKCTVHFIHQSAKDYMLDYTKDLFSCTREDEHQQISLQCFQYIDHFPDLIEIDTKCNEETVVNALAKAFHGGHQYPIQYWTLHADHASKKLNSLNVMSHVILRRKSELFQAWLSRYRPNITRLCHRHVPIQHFAAYEGKFGLLSWLFHNHGPEVIHEAIPEDNTTPLVWAVRGGKAETVRWLLERGACPNIIGKSFDGNPRKYHYTVITIAARESIQIFDLLLQFGADLNFCNAEGESNLFLEALSGSNSEEAALTAFRVLLDRGADPNSSRNDGVSLLHVAARWRSIHIIQVLLEYGANPNIRDINGQTPLHYAAYNEKLGNLSFLCVSGADMDLKDNENNTALYYAALYGDHPVVESLVGHGASYTQFQEGAKIHNEQTWRGTKWHGFRLVNHRPHLSHSNDKSNTSNTLYSVII